MIPGRRPHNTFAALRLDDIFGSYITVRYTPTPCRGFQAPDSGIELGLILTVEDGADRGVFEHGLNSIGQNLGYREYF